MNDVAASIGLIQLRRLGGFLERRHEVAAAYDEALADLSWLRLPPLQGTSARIFYWVQLAAEQRAALASHLLERDVYSSFRYWPLHKTQLYRSERPFPGADSAAMSTLLLPLHQGLANADVELVVSAVRSFGGGA
jgi:aminotransferase